MFSQKGMPVTQFVKNTPQPRGGYLKPKDFTITQHDDGRELAAVENLHSTIVGMVVDYMVRYMLERDAHDAFSISLMGASIVGDNKKAEKLVNTITGLDDASITAGCLLSGYDVIYRAGEHFYDPTKTRSPDADTINNIRIMAERTINFFAGKGEVISGITFLGGYTENVSKGDADFIVGNTLWDLKVSKAKPNSKQTFQLLLYWMLHKNSIHCDERPLDSLGIFNPRLNTSHKFLLENIPDAVHDEVMHLMGPLKY